MSKVQVWVKRRKRKKGYSYLVQWQDPRTGKTRTESCGSDKAYARQQAAERHRELITGVFREITLIEYETFMAEHLEVITGTLTKATCIEHDRVLR